MDVQYERYTYGNGGTLLFFKVLGLVYGHTYICEYGQLCDHGLPNFPQGMGATCVPALLNIGTQGMHDLFL